MLKSHSFGVLLPAVASDLALRLIRTSRLHNFPAKRVLFWMQKYCDRTLKMRWIVAAKLCCNSDRPYFLYALRPIGMSSTRLQGYLIKKNRKLSGIVINICLFVYHRINQFPYFIRTPFSAKRFACRWDSAKSGLFRQSFYSSWASF